MYPAPFNSSHMFSNTDYAFNIKCSVYGPVNNLINAQVSLFTTKLLIVKTLRLFITIAKHL